MSTGLDFRFHAERTPNPQSLKWVLSQEITPPGVTANFQEPVGAEISPLAARIFAIPDVVGVFLAPSFVTVTKSEAREWTELAQPIVDALKAFGAAQEPALGPAFSAADRPEETGIVARIKEILENEVRPAVARDGGDVVFAGFHDGVVEVVLQGSCVGCPSSTATLRFGIEGRLREAIPEVIKVIQV